MRQFAANLSILFPTLPYLDRFRAAAEAGFELIESWWPADPLAEGITADDIVRHARENGLRVVLLNFAAGNMKAGDRGLASDPTFAAEFRANVPVAIDLAGRLGCRKLNALAGNALGDSARPAQLDLLAENVAFAADAAAAAGMSVMLEALNPRETPRYLLPGTDAALEVIARVGRPNVRFQLDAYHVAMAGEDPVESVRRAGPLIGHVQLADMPGRHEPGSGELPFGAILAALDDAGYRDPIGLEFVPLDPAAPDFACVGRLGGTLAPAGSAGPAGKGGSAANPTAGKPAAG
jgi:hydroxypyruvate isomerase